MNYEDITPREELHETIKQLRAENQAKAERIEYLEQENAELKAAINRGDVPPLPSMVVDVFLNAPIGTKMTIKKHGEKNPHCDIVVCNLFPSLKNTPIGRYTLPPAKHFELVVDVSELDKKKMIERIEQLEEAVREALNIATAEWKADREHPASRHAYDVKYFEQILKGEKP